MVDYVIISYFFANNMLRVFLPMKGFSCFIFLRLEDSAVNLAESIQQGAIPAPGSLAPSIIEVLVIVTFTI